jgi:hypothetical protein
MVAAQKNLGVQMVASKNELKPIAKDIETAQRIGAADATVGSNPSSI